MVELLIKLVGSVPALVAFIIVTVLFLRALRSRDDTIETIAKDFANTSRLQTEESKKLRETLGANSEIIKQCQVALRS